jgi:hypothetical protein
MGTISIHDLRPTGADLFDDSESYIQDLGVESSTIIGGLPIGSAGSSVICATLFTIATIVLSAGPGTVAPQPEDPPPNGGTDGGIDGGVN